MIYRVSFYRRAEVVAGRAPRYMVDVNNPDSTEDSVRQGVMEKEPDAVIRSIYKSPLTPIRKKPSYVFETTSARNEWYSSHKSTQVERLCHICNKNEVERYKRLCKECRSKRETLTEKSCTLCGKSIPTPSRHRFCDECAIKRKDSQEKFHREKRAKQATIDRIREQIAWAKDRLPTTTLVSCKLSSRFQGVRIPHVMEDENGFSPKRCRTCLQKFIDVQTVKLENLMAESEPLDTTAFITELLES